jgi:hypothetical protein
MAYTNQKKTSVKEVIERYTNDYLDRYTQADVIKQAEDAMNDSKTAIEVANAVYDYIYANNCSNIVISTALQQCMPKDVLIILRQDIIGILK